jgi:RNA polymerase sigma-70 factor (sigma-E family)
VRRDDDEFAAFVSASQAGLRRTAYLLCGDWDLASDFVQEGLVKVYRRWPRLRRDGALTSYAKRAVVSAVVDAKRRRSSREVPMAEVALTTVPAPSTGPEPGDRDLMVRCLATLAPRQRACVVLRYYDDLAVADVAAALGCSEGTVKSQTARGLAALKAAYAAATGDDLVTGGKQA